MSTEADKLRAAKALIEDPKNWKTGVLATNRSGQEVLCDGPEAICFCARGAAWNVVANENLLEQAAELLGASKQGPFLSFVGVNDRKKSLADGSTGHPAVMKIYDKAIELAEASQ